MKNGKYFTKVLSSLKKIHVMKNKLKIHCVILLSDNPVDTNLQCSASGSTEDDLEISMSWTSVGECGQYTLSWTGTALWSSTLTDTGSEYLSSGESYTITDVIPGSEYDISLLSAGDEVDSCSIITPETGKR